MFRGQNNSRWWSRQAAKMSKLAKYVLEELMTYSMSMSLFYTDSPACAFTRSFIRLEARRVCSGRGKPVFPSKHSDHRYHQHYPPRRSWTWPAELWYGVYSNRCHYKCNHSTHYRQYRQFLLYVHVNEWNVIVFFFFTVWQLRRPPCKLGKNHLFSSLIWH